MLSDIDLHIDETLERMLDEPFNYNGFEPMNLIAVPNPTLTSTTSSICHKQTAEVVAATKEHRISAAKENCIYLKRCHSIYVTVAHEAHKNATQRMRNTIRHGVLIKRC